VQLRAGRPLCGCIQAPASIVPFPLKVAVLITKAQLFFFHLGSQGGRQHTPGGIACAQKWAAFHTPTTPQSTAVAMHVAFACAAGMGSDVTRQ
jgi:hypothetical protein